VQIGILQCLTNRERIIDFPLKPSNSARVLDARLVQCRSIKHDLLMEIFNHFIYGADEMVAARARLHITYANSVNGAIPSTDVHIFALLSNL
jgi:hypothetical protein